MAGFAAALYGDDINAMNYYLIRHPDAINMFSNIIIDDSDEDEGTQLTPLQNAIIRDNMEIVNFLIASGSNVNIQNNDGWTALHFACYFSNRIPKEGPIISRNSEVELIEKLIAAGADGNIQDNMKETALHFSATVTSNPDIIYLLSEVTDPNILNWTDSTALIEACGARIGQDYNAEVILALITVTDNLNQKDIYGKTAIWRAAAEDWPEIVRRLLDKGADPYIEDSTGNSGFVYAGKKSREILTSRYKYVDTSSKYVYFPSMGMFMTRR